MPHLADFDGSLHEHNREWQRRLFWRSVRHGLVAVVVLLSLAAAVIAFWPHK